MTKDGYSPTRPLRWADLDDAPFLTVNNPPLKNGAYTMTGKLPAGRTGRHLIYTVWQTNPDTYYSCSDVNFGKAAEATTRPSKSAAPKAPSTTKPAGAQAKKVEKVEEKKAEATHDATVTEAPTEIPTVAATTDPAIALDTGLTGGTTATTDDSFPKPVLALVGVLALAGTGGAAVLARRGRRRSHREL